VTTYGGPTDDITCIEWSPCSTYVAVGSRDCVCRVFHALPVRGFRPPRLAAHRTELVGCFHGTCAGEGDAPGAAVPPREALYTVSRDGALMVWVKEPVDLAALRKRRRMVAQRKAGGGTLKKQKRGAARAPKRKPKSDADGSDSDGSGSDGSDAEDSSDAEESSDTEDSLDSAEADSSRPVPFRYVIFFFFFLFFFCGFFFFFFLLFFF
jgi:hypothetical protein